VGGSRGRTGAFRREPGSSPSLVFIHGAAESAGVYDRLLDAIPGFARYAINLPGRAGSDGPPLEAVASLADWLAEFVNTEIEGRYVLVGHSLGGAIALEHAISGSSERLAGLVLLSTGARLRVHPFILELHEQAAHSGGELPPLAPGLYEEGADPTLLAEANRYRALTPATTGASDWRAADTFDRILDLASVEVPALIVAGSDDTLTPPKYAEYMASHIVGSELHLLDGGRHMLIMERPSELAPLITRFVERL